MLKFFTNFYLDLDLNIKHTLNKYNALAINKTSYQLTKYLK